MKKIFALVFAAAFVFLAANTGFSHGPGSTHHAATSAEIDFKARKIVADLVEKGKLDNSWAEVKVSSVDKKDISGVTEWVVTFVNKAEKDKDKATLYVFFTLNGKYLASNFTGK